MSQLDCGNPRIVGFYQRAMLLPGCSQCHSMVIGQCSTLSCRRPSPAYDALHTRRRQVGSFHRLKASKRVQYRLMTIVSPHYLAADLRRLSDMPSRRYVCGHSSLDHRSARCPPVAVLQTDRLLLLDARLWNCQTVSLPPDIVVCDILSRTVPSRTQNISNQIKFIKRRRTKLVTNTSITVGLTQHNAMK